MSRYERDNGTKQKAMWRLAFLCVALTSMTGMAQTRVQFTDWRLKSAVEAALGVTDPTTDDMQRLKTLNAEDQGITSMKGLEYAANLVTLKLAFNQIRDLTPLTALAKLETLDLKANKISQIPSLSGMKGLFTLNLKYNSITQCGGLSGLPRLWDLNLAYNEITSLADLSNLPILDSLFVHGNPLTSIPAFPGMKALKYVHFSDCKVRDLTPLSNVSTLVEIGMSGNQISDLGPLSGLSNLNRLWAGGNPIHDISPIADLPRLQGLYLENVQLTDYAPLGSMTGLTDLSLRGNKLTDISFLQSLTAMEYLTLSDNSISDISALASLSELIRLELASNQIRDVSALGNLRQLRYLVLTSNPLSTEAYATQLCTIKLNNPGILLYYDSRLVAPTEVSASDGSCLDAVEVTWDALLPDNPCGDTPYYRIFRSNTPSGFKSALGAWQVATAFRDTTAVPGTTYYYWVAAAANASGKDQTGYSDCDAGFRGLAVVHVDDDFPGDPGPFNPAISDPCENGSPEHPFDTIQESIAYMANGATAVVHPGIYREALRVDNRSIRLLGLSDPDSYPGRAVVAGNDSEPTTSFYDCQEPGVLMNGLVLTGGRGPDGSAVVSHDSFLTISNCVIAANVATAVNGCAVYCLRGRPVLLNCTLYGNDSPDVACLDSDAIIRNCILWSNGASEIQVLSGPDPAVTHSCIRGGWPGQGNVDFDPMFLDPAGPDGVLGTADDNLRLQLESPCVDAGDYPVPEGSWDDLDGNSRLRDGVVDIGAYEYVGRVWYVDAAAGSDTADGFDRHSALRTIQKAIDLSTHKDVILVYPGTYTGQCNFRGKAVVVQGVAESGGIPILENAFQPCVRFENDEGRNSVLSNCVIRESPTAILVQGSSPTLRNLTITQNADGIRAEGASDPCVASCIFWGNSLDDIQGCVGQHCWSEDAFVARPFYGRTACWSLDDGEGQTAWDTVSGQAAALVGCTWVAGEVGQALRLDGLDDHVSLPGNNPAWLPHRDFTIALWVYAERFPGQVQEVILDLDYAASGTTTLQGMALIRDEETGGLTFRMAQSAGYDGTLSAKDAVIPRKAWSHIAITRAKSRVVLYLNGQTAATYDGTSAAMPYTSAANDDQVCLGKLSGASGLSAFHYRGRIDEVMFFNRALGSDEVTQFFVTGLVPAGAPADPLLADPLRGDYHLRAEAGRYAMDAQTWLQDDSTSPCLDAGDPGADYREEPSPNGRRVNVGAYGGTPFASQSPQW